MPFYCYVNVTVKIKKKSGFWRHASCLKNFVNFWLNLNFTSEDGAVRNYFMVFGALVYLYKKNGSAQIYKKFCTMFHFYIVKMMACFFNNIISIN